jgi:hypothetical protein
MTHSSSINHEDRPGTDDLLKVTGVQNQAEAEVIQGLLLEQGVRSLLRRAAGFDVHGLLARVRLTSSFWPPPRSSHATGC